MPSLPVASFMFLVALSFKTNWVDCYSYIGCFKDVINMSPQQYSAREENATSTPVAGRALHAFVRNFPDTLTVEKCIDFCSTHALGAKYVGLQYSTWCFCGSDDNYGRYGFSPKCTYKCSGNDQQICGGAGANSVYSIEDISMVHLGCFEDRMHVDPHTYSIDDENRTSTPVAGRDLTGFFIYDRYSMTVEACYNICKKRGFKYVGLQFSISCFCGDDQRYGISNKCTYKCSGNDQEICGGAGANSVYKIY